MSFRIGILIVFALSTGTCNAADIQGSIIIRHKLTKRKVTASADPYQRGMAVELASDLQQDQLSFERSHVAVYLDGPLASSPTTATLEQRNRRFSPDLLVVSAGSTVSFPNLDPIFHNVFSLSKPKNFDLGNYAKGQTRTVVFPQPGIVMVNCRLHPNMSAAIVVTPNQWYTRSDATGQFVIRNVPAGKHVLVAWHKSAGFFRHEVQLTASSGAVVAFEIPLDENGEISPKAFAQR